MKSHKQGFLKNENYVFDIFTDDKAKELIKKVEEGCSLIGGLFDVSTGVKEYQIGKGEPKQTKQDKEDRVFNASYKINETFIPELRGRNINRYSIQWNNEYLSYGPWIAEPRDPKFFKGERILIRKIPNKLNLVVSYTDEPYVIDQSIYAAINTSDLDTKYILCILNSKLIGYYFKNKFSEFDDVFPQIKIGHFKSLPIKLASTEIQQLFVVKANMMLTLNTDLQSSTDKLLRSITRHYNIQSFSTKLQNWHQLTFKEFISELNKLKIKLSLSKETEWEEFFITEKSKTEQIKNQLDITDNEIDLMIYSLYDLTNEEIAIIEST